MDADSDRKPSPNDDAIGQTEVTSFKEQNIEQFTESSAAKKKIKYRTIQTVCLCASTFGVGLIGAIVGTTMIHVGLLYDVSTSYVSLSLSLESAAALTGILIHRLMTRWLTFECAVISSFCVYTILTICAPFIVAFPGFAAALTIRGLAAGFYFLTSQSFCIDAWKDTRHQAAVTRSENAMWSAGATISPFIIERFLIEVVELANKFNATVGSSQFEYSMNTSMTSGYRSSAAGDVATTSSYFRTAQDVVTGADDVPLEGLELVRYAYVVIGLIALLTVVPMTVLQCYLSGPFASSRKHQKSDDRGRNNLNSVAAEKSLQLQVSTSSRRRHLVINFVYLAVVFLIGFLYGGLETTPRSFLTSFAIRHLSWSVRNATWCMSVFYGTFCFGRIIAVPQSAILSPGVSLIVGIVLVGSGLGLLELLDLDVILSPIFVWISSGLAGFGMSSMFASLLLVVCMAEPTDDARRTVSLSTPTIVSMLGIGCFIGSTVFPFVVGYLFDHISPMWMVYVLIGDVTSLTGLLFLKRTLG